LNESALDAVRRVHKFRPIPSEWGEDKMDIRVPLKFLTI
jgi:outer membrane biosynthesis protein TonB